MKNTVVIGAGPAGMMAAGHAAAGGGRIILVDKNRRPGRKLMITGKGRCNLTNNCGIEEFLENVPTNPRFLYSALNAFPPAETMEFFERRGLALKTERGGRVFPKSDNAADVVEALHRFILDSGVNLICGRAAKIVTESNRVAGVILANGRRLDADAVILAAGGASYPLTGSCGEGYFLAEQLGHTLIPLRPALAPMELKGSLHVELQGLSLKNVTMTLKQEGRVLFKELGEMLFTHFGISGPLTLSASSRMKENAGDGYKVEIDLKPGLDEKKLDKRILRDFEENINRDFVNSLSALLPNRLIPVIVKLSSIPANQKVNTVTAAQRAVLVHLIKALTFDVAGLRPLEEAIVTGGGIKVNEIDPRTMESKIVKGVHFAGEIIDVDGFTGGFNLQIAFCTGYLAGTAISN